MIWNNLKKYICPKCSSRLVSPPFDAKSALGGLAYMHRCTSRSCDFSISDEKYAAILRGKTKIHTPSEEENLSELNNL